MRTEADLQAAFGLLEREVDEYLHAKIDTEPTAPLELQRRIVRRRRRPMVAVAAAAVTALLVLGGLAAYRFTRAEPIKAGGNQPAVSHRLPFALKPGSGFTFVGAGTDEGVLVKDGRTYFVDVHAPGAKTNITSLKGAHVVTVAGHRAWFGCITSDPPGDWRRCKSGPLAWQYRPSAWVEVSGPGLANLMRLGSHLDFDRHTEARSPLRLAVPEGARLTAWEVVYPGAPRTQDGPGPWRVTAVYQWRRTGASVEIDAFALAPTTREGIRRVTTVNGHPAWWYPRMNNLDVQLGPKLMFMVRGEHLGEATALAIARTIRLAPAPEDVHTWWPLKQALP